MDQNDLGCMSEGCMTQITAKNRAHCGTGGSVLQT